MWLPFVFTISVRAREHDVAVVGVVPCVSAAYKGQMVDVTVTVENGGDSS